MTTKVLALAMMAAFATAANAQVVTTQTENPAQVVSYNTTPQNAVTLTNEQLVDQYKKQLDVINLEIKTLKAQAKLYKGDTAKSAEVASLLASKKVELADIKAKKKVAEKAIKAEKARKKAEEKAEKARRDAEAAAAKAAKLQQ